MQTERLILLSDISVLQKNKLVLTHVDLEVYAGEFLYLIGKTGSGKSSLLQLLYADLALEQGEATVCGYNLKLMKRKEVPFLRRKLGIVFQDFQLLDDRNVRKNLQFVLKATGWTDVVKIEDRILQVLDEVNLVDKLNAMPHQLSGGEQQRIAIARALLNQPEVLLADEPTGNLDPDTSNGIMRILFNISEKGSAVIMATHNYNLINKFPGKVLRCEEGTLLISGQQSD
ncbi:MAG: phosphonate ABC transporter ATP-binding protein [Bacteroidetes bacterium CG18_big_fil_WC_8_21_14_2_50_41_14]|nr:MAG: phosphonate ABC transporter ATP-binding protein [Bacteroidetes bacterium CG18_big_fil_WC_8_21_14_2_50_41_14]PJB58570.1 MAG: phosphonate ABC transporter ATP-binding protein [Bacteroidetes bacterium CG_4_9_14_3_um_filter_41_19]